MSSLFRPEKSHPDPCTLPKIFSRWRDVRYGVSRISGNYSAVSQLSGPKSWLYFGLSCYDYLPWSPLSGVYLINLKSFLSSTLCYRRIFIDRFILRVTDSIFLKIMRDYEAWKRDYNSKTKVANFAWSETGLKVKTFLFLLRDLRTCLFLAGFIYPIVHLFQILINTV